MKMKKLLMTGAALVLVAGMGITVAAAGTIKQGSGGQHHMSHSQWHLDGRNCVTAKAGRIVTYGVHHAEPEGGDRTGILADAVDYTDGTGSCHISDGYCMKWSDADGDGVCDLCRNPAYHESGAESGAGGNCHISDGYCVNWSDADGDGVCDLCRNPAYHESGAESGAGGNCHISDGYCMNWSDADGDGVCDLCRNPAYCESGDGNGAQGSGNAVSQDSGSTAGSQGQNYGGYDLECYGTDYNGCGNSGRGHHSSGHHGRGHHR